MPIWQCPSDTYELGCSSNLHRPHTPPSRPRLAALHASPFKGKGAAKLAKHEQRRLAKERRAAEWAAFLATKPDSGRVDPADAAAIEHAGRNMGDFKLKADPEFTPADGEAVTAARKKLQARPRQPDGSCLVSVCAAHMCQNTC